MKNLRTILIFVVIIFFLLLAVFFYGRYQGKQAGLAENKPANVTSRVILERITDQYFLVTKTVFVDSRAEIETPKTNDWRDLFVGKKISVLGLVRVDVGIDMKNLRLENISVDHSKKTVTITLPHAQILNSSLSGELDVTADNSIVEKIKNLLKNTRNEDYNLALQTLINNANNEVMANERIFAEARSDSAKLVELIVSSMLKGYNVIIN